MTTERNRLVLIRTISCTIRGSLLATVVWCALCLVASAGFAQERNTAKSNGTVVVLYENDVHCAIDGYAKVAGLRDAIRDTADVLLVSSGDYLQGGLAGSVSKGQYIADIMSAVGYDAVTLGNHEFDYKVPRLLELTSQMGCKTVCANFFDVHGDTTLYAPFVIKKAGRWNIAFIGVVAPSTMSTERYAFFDDDGTPLYTLKADRVYALVQESADKARREGADFVIVLSHLGEEKSDENVDSHGLASMTRGIDVILDAHTHSLRPADTVLNLDGRPVAVTQTGAEFANVGKLLIDSDGSMSLSMIPLSSVSLSSPSVAKVTDEVKRKMDEVANRVVCHSDYDLTILDDAGEYLVRYAETNAGDIITDAYLYATGAEVAFTNAGGIRNELKAGALTYGDMVRLLPYDNLLTVVEVKGSTIVEMLKRTTASMSYDNGDFPQCAGIRFKIHTAVHAITDVEVAGSDGKYEPLDPERTYRLVTIDYCVAGGGFARVLAGSKVLMKTNINYRDALIDYIEKSLGGVIGIGYAKPQGRIIVVE